MSKNVEAEEENLSGNLVLLIKIPCNIIKVSTLYKLNLFSSENLSEFTMVQLVELVLIIKKHTKLQ